MLAPTEIAGGVERLLAIFADLEGGRRYEVEVVAVEAGGCHRLRPDIDLEFFATDHWVPTLGCRVVWQKRRLRGELAGLPGEEIARRRRPGLVVTEVESRDLLAYCADSGPGLFAAQPEVLATEVVLVECSFFQPTDRDRAARYGHLHLDDLLAVADRLACRHLVLAPRLPPPPAARGGVIPLASSWSRGSSCRAAPSHVDWD